MVLLDTNRTAGRWKAESGAPITISGRARNPRHPLHFLDVPDEVCRARMHARNRAGDHKFALTDDQFAEITSYFEPPGESEGFYVVRYAITE